MNIYLDINAFKLLLPKFIRLMALLISFKNSYFHFISTAVMLLYNPIKLLLPYFANCNCVWGNSKIKFMSLFTGQKRAIRYVDID